MWKVPLILITLIVGSIAQLTDDDDYDTGLFPPDCKDEADWCTEMPERDCYVNNDTCCQTCSLLKRSEEDCPYGDHTGWCDSIHPSLCYRPHENSTCCETCKRLNTGPRGCEFGDRVSWCEETEGVCDTMTKMLCCKTCKDKGSFNLQEMFSRWKGKALGN